MARIAGSAEWTARRRAVGRNHMGFKPSNLGDGNETYTREAAGHGFWSDSGAHGGEHVPVVLASQRSAANTGHNPKPARSHARWREAIAERSVSDRKQVPAGHPGRGSDGAQRGRDPTLRRHLEQGGRRCRHSDRTLAEMVAAGKSRPAGKDQGTNPPASHDPTGHD